MSIVTVHSNELSLGNTTECPNEPSCALLYQHSSFSSFSFFLKIPKIFLKIFITDLLVMHSLFYNYIISHQTRVCKDKVLIF